MHFSNSSTGNILRKDLICSMILFENKVMYLEYYWELQNRMTLC